jgi:glutamate carboxypeptidase
MLVNTDSGTFDKSGVDAVSHALRGRYAALGCEIRVYPNDVYGDSFAASLTGSGRAKLLLIGHTDTVFPDGTAGSRPFRIEGGRAYGPGVADMKSGDLAIVYALSALQTQGCDTFARLTVFHNSDEEIGSPSSRELIRAEAERADAVLVLEPGRENGAIVSARKGVANCRLTVTGQAAHAGVNRERGVSAAVELAHLVVALEGLNGSVPGATLNVGRMEAGDRVNVVPDHAFAHFEVRAFKKEHLETMLERVTATVERRTLPGTTAQLDLSIEHYPMHKSAESERLVSLAKSVAARLGFDITDVATGGASDGNTAAAAGRPVLDGLGPIGGRAHSPQEYMEIASAVPRTALLAGLVSAIGNGGW